MQRRLFGALFLIACGGAEPDSAPPPQTNAELDTLRARGHELFFGRAGCAECHKVGDEGDKIRGPNLGVGDDMTAPVATRAAARRPELAPGEYLVESILDPDAVVVDGYAKGVMKRPDQPPISLTDDEVVALAVYLGADDPEAARAYTATARAARDRRVADAWADTIIRRIPWDRCDHRRGEALYRDLGCALCHDNPANPEVGAPSLDGVGDRLSRDDLARWVVAPPQTKMPSYADTIDEVTLGHLCEYLTSR